MSSEQALTGTKPALDQNSSYWFGVMMGITSKKTCNNFAPEIQPNTTSNVKLNCDEIYSAESCDQNEMKIPEIESLSSLQ